jgi:hypothetical protein
MFGIFQYNLFLRHHSSVINPDEYKLSCNHRPTLNQMLAELWLILMKLGKFSPEINIANFMHKENKIDRDNSMNCPQFESAFAAYILVKTRLESTRKSVTFDC